MQNHIFQHRRPREGLARLAARAADPGFGAALLAHLAQVAPMANLGAFHMPDLGAPAPRLTLWSGEMSSYWFNRNAATILADDMAKEDIVSRIRDARSELLIDRWHPPKGDPRAPIYARDGVIERVTVSSRVGHGGLLTFLLRGNAQGWITQGEMAALEVELPLAHELIALRHRILSPAPGASARSLRERGVGAFGALTPREAEICDCVVRGLSVAGSAAELGISENSIRTLRARAYRRLGVGSAAQLVAMVLR